jgi:hypothetical protein
MEQESVAPVHQTFGVGTHAPGTYINPEGVKHEIPNNVDMYLSTDTESSESTPPSKQRKVMDSVPAPAAASAQKWSDFANRYLKKARKKNAVEVQEEWFQDPEVIAEMQRLWEQFTSVYNKTRGRGYKFFAAKPFAMKHYIGWGKCVKASNHETIKVWESQCEAHAVLEHVVPYKIVRAQMMLTPGENEADRKSKGKDTIQYLNHILNWLSRECDYYECPGVIMYATLLFERLQQKFGGEDAEMQDWFYKVDGKVVDKKNGRVVLDSEGDPEQKLHSLSDTARQMAQQYGVLSIMFGMCAYLAFVHLQDESMGVLNEDYAQLIFARKRCKDDFIVLQAATLDKFDWKTHISVEEYVAGVQAFEDVEDHAAHVRASEKFAQEDKDKILRMFADEEKAHTEEIVREAPREFYCTLSELWMRALEDQRMKEALVEALKEQRRKQAAIC